jgi:hypothetical protein
VKGSWNLVYALEGVDGFRNVAVHGGHAGDHEGARVASQRVTQHHRERVLPVGHVAASLLQSLHHEA